MMDRMSPLAPAHTRRATRPHPPRSDAGPAIGVR
jgi:hypothetical protein